MAMATVASFSGDTGSHRKARYAPPTDTIHGMPRQVPNAKRT